MRCKALKENLVLCCLMVLVFHLLSLLLQLSTQYPSHITSDIMMYPICLKGGVRGELDYLGKAL